MVSKRVFEEQNKVIKHFLQTIQIILTNTADVISGNELKRLISLHQVVPVLHVPFITVLLQGYQALLPALEFHEQKECNAFSLNLSQVDLPNVKDQKLVDTYNDCIAL
jgi:hypothetical protein